MDALDVRALESPLHLYAARRQIAADQLRHLFTPFRAQDLLVGLAGPGLHDFFWPISFSSISFANV